MASKTGGTPIAKRPKGDYELAKSMSEPAREKGYLQKKSSKGAWQKRWFELHGPFFCYWASHKNTEGKAETPMPLAAYDVRMMESVNITADGTLTLVSANGNTFCLKSQAKADYLPWVKALETAKGAAGQGPAADGESFTTLEDGGEPVTMEEALSMAKSIAAANPENRAVKHLLALESEGVLNDLSEEVAERLIACVKTGLANPDSGLGCYAMDPKDYDDLAFFFDRVCNDYHDNPKGDKIHTTTWSLDGVENLPADGQLDISKLGLGDELSMRVRVGRNLTTFPLPGAMTKGDRINFEKTMLAAFAKLIANPEYGGQVFSMTPHEDWKDVTGEATNPNLISAEKYQELVNAHVMFKDMAADPYLAAAGIASHWPCGRGCYQSKDGGFIIWFGEEDQLRIMCMAKGFVLNSVFDRLHAALQMVESIDGIDFAMSAKYGYVTSCPSNLGTGMRASVHLKIPNLTKDGTDAKAKAAAKPLGLSVRGTGGEHTPIGADGTVDISPSKRLFISEAEIIVSLYRGIKLLLVEEYLAPLAEISAGEVKTGMLKKAGHGLIDTGMKERYFVLERDGTNFYLKYYLPEDHEQVKGAITLRKAVADFSNGSESLLEVTEDAQVGGKKYIIEVPEGGMEAQQWLAAIQFGIKMDK